MLIDTTPLPRGARTHPPSYPFSPYLVYLQPHYTSLITCTFEVAITRSNVHVFKIALRLIEGGTTTHHHRVNRDFFHFPFLLLARLSALSDRLVEPLST